MEVRKSLQCLLFVLTVSSVWSDECVRYTFEDDFQDLFDNMEAPCFGMPFWHQGNYASINIDGLNDRGETFISPAGTEFSCVSSFPFGMSVEGSIEVNIYVDSVNAGDNIIILASHVIPDGDDANVETVTLIGSTLETGWHNIRFPLRSTLEEQFTGYVSSFYTYIPIRESNNAHT